MDVERRLYQRIPVQVSAIITTEQGVRIKAVAVDVSSSGFGIECHTKQRNIMTPGGSFVHDGKPISVFVDLDLSDDNEQPLKIAARCYVVFSRRMSSDQCKIGLRYADIEHNNCEYLARFIGKKAEKPELKS